MSNVFANRVLVSTTTTGTGTVTLGAALAGYRTFASAGIANAAVVRYLILDGNAWEIGTGTYTASGTTLSRTVQESSAGGTTALNLTGGARVAIIAAAQDYTAFVKGPASVTNDHLAIFDGATGKLVKDGGIRGTAANATVTTSATDTTAGRLLKVGDFGLGGQGVAFSGDADTLTSAGFYNLGAAANVFSTFDALLHVPRGADRGFQLNAARTTSELAFRVKDGATWTSWRRIYQPGNLLGTVSESGGVPTGAVLQGNASAATPAGGYSERMADGFQRVHHVVTTSSSADTTVTFTNAFLAGSTPAVNITPLGDSELRPRIVSISATAVVLSVRDGSNNRVAVPAHIQVSGRWSNMT
jgi:hypothetical protein